MKHLYLSICVFLLLGLTSFFFIPEKRCEIGMTTNLKRRLTQKARIYNHDNIKITQYAVLGHFILKEDAQNFETMQARKQGCYSWPGGRNPKNKSIWTVYKLKLEGFKWNWEKYNGHKK